MKRTYRAGYNQDMALGQAALKIIGGHGKIENVRSRGKRRASALMASCAFCLVLFPVGQAWAADCNWLGQSDGWFDSGNWELCAGGIPTAADTASIDGLGSFNPVVGSGESAESGNLFLRYGGGLTVNGLLDSDAGLIADLDHPTDVATVTVEGGDAVWALGGLLSVGRTGQGALDIKGGAEVRNEGNGYIGELAGSEGVVTVDGEGSRWNNGDRLLVGVLSKGTLNLSGGAEVTNGAEGIIGDQESGSGEVTVDDSSWVSGGLLYVGNYGAGTLDIVNGGSVANTYGTAGFYAGSSGEIKVDGLGSIWSSSEEINIGNYGEGALNITGGGHVTGASSSRIGNYAGSTGEVTVSGAGSRWSNTGTLYVGRLGKGTLTVGNGGDVEVGAGSGTLVLADDAGADGTINIGAAPGAAPAAPGTVSAGSIVFGDGDGTLVFNHTDTDYTFDADIIGDGTIRQEAGTTNYTGDGSAFSGGVIVNGGDFNAHGEMGGEYHIADDANVRLIIPEKLIMPEIELSGGGDLYKFGGGEIKFKTSLDHSFAGRVAALRGRAAFFIDASRSEIHIGGAFKRPKKWRRRMGNSSR